MNKQQQNGEPHNIRFRRRYFKNGRYAGCINRLANQVLKSKGDTCGKYR